MPWAPNSGYRLVGAYVTVFFIILLTNGNPLQTPAVDADASSSNPIKSIDPLSVLRWRKDNICLLIDMRSIDHFAKGHIAGSIHVSQLAQHHSLGAGESWETSAKGKSVFVVAICESGDCISSAVTLKKILGQKPQIFLLEGGYLRWADVNLPIERS